MNDLNAGLGVAAIAMFLLAEILLQLKEMHSKSMESQQEILRNMFEIRQELENIRTKDLYKWPPTD